MYILCNGNWNNPEIEISSSPVGLIELGSFFLSVDRDCEIKSEPIISRFYSENFEKLKILFVKNDLQEQERVDLLKVFVEQKQIIFQGGKIAFNNLGDSILNYFDMESKNGDHFHLDYIEGDMLLAPTNCHLIFLCKRQ
jgi:hypothetical protein